MKCLYPIADHPVHQFVMPVIRANMYVLIDGTDALVIDPHVCPEAEELLRGAGVRDCVVLLTHEHFDHASGVNRLRELFSCHVVCTAACAGLIGHAKRSGAASFGALFLLGHSEEERKEIEPWLAPDYTCRADETYEDEMKLDWHGVSFLLKEWKGHSRGSQMIEAEGRYIFTGDNLVPGEQVITRLPGGSRAIYEETVRPYLLGLPDHYIVFPGHGEVDCITAPGMQQGLSL